MKRIQEVLRNVFPTHDVTTASPTTRLDSIPGWDSMTSITFLMQLEKTFGVDLSDLSLSDESTISDVIAMLERKGVAPPL